MATPTTNTELLKSHEKGLVKQYIDYDASGRPEYVYTADIHVTDGGACLVTQYVYDGVSTRVLKRKEGYSTWDATYDI